MEVISANAIDYKQVQLSHPEYQFQMVPPNTNGQEIILGSSRSPVQFTIPDNVFNWYTSNLSYNIKIPAGGANQYIWYALQPLKEISQMEFYGANGGQWAVNIDNFQNYLDIILKKESSLEDFLTYDQLTGMSRNNSVVNVVPALRNSTTAGVNTPDGPAYPSSINYEEPGYFKVTPVANQELTYEVQFPLGLIKNSLFAVNKDL
ncbi:MAG TPA: hypothetical protein PLS50_06425, partial [Candidatus Dojkabacteria bacterium]|nr:hypothetical protein [Candidatus Dojkabacteria bacterium]